MTATLSDPTPTRDHWGRVWQRTTIDRPLHRHLIEAVGAALELDGATVLEIGCGSAVDCSELARRGARTFAADYSRAALQRAQGYIAGDGDHTRLAAGDTFRLPYRTGAFDLVFSQGLLEHFTDPVPALREQLRVVRPGGLLCVDVPQTWSLATLSKRWQIRRGTWFAGWETSFSLPQLERLIAAQGAQVVSSYGWLYFPSLVFGLRNLHTLDERHRLPLWLDAAAKRRAEERWRWLERQRWFYRWLGCVGVIARKVEGSARQP